MNTAISLLNAKEAAIYFDYVVPLGIAWHSVEDGLEDKNLGPEEVKALLLPPNLKNNSEFMGEFAAIQSKLYEHIMKSFAQNLDPSLRTDEMNAFLKKFKNANSLEKANELASSVVHKFDLSKFPVSDSEQFRNSSHSVTDDLSLALKNIRLVDASKTKWKQIADFRQDTEAKMKLRRLRVFAFENYSEKPLSFIEDDLCRRKEDYEDVVAKWGFETREGVINAVASSKVLAGGGVASVASIAAGMPVPALMSALATSGVEIAKLGMYISKRKLELRHYMRESPFSFFGYADARLAARSSDLRER